VEAPENALYFSPIGLRTIAVFCRLKHPNRIPFR